MTHTAPLEAPVRPCRRSARERSELLDLCREAYRTFAISEGDAQPAQAAFTVLIL
jgi:hypothetical protein